MRHQLKLAIYISAAAAYALAVGAGHSQDRFIPIAQFQKAASDETKGFAGQATAGSVNKMPDGTEILLTFKAAKTVADIEAGNELVKHSLAMAQDVERALSLQAAAAWSCDQAQLTKADASIDLADVGAKAGAFESTLADIERRMKKSFEKMQRDVGAGIPDKNNKSDFKRTEQLRRYQIAFSELSRHRVHAQEIRKSINRTGAGVMKAQCQPGAIPPLYETGNGVSARTAETKVLSLNPVLGGVDNAQKGILGR